MNDLFPLDDTEKVPNVSIHLRDLSKDDSQLLSDVLLETGHKTLSKACLEAFAGYLLYKRRSVDLERRYMALVNKYRDA